MADTLPKGYEPADVEARWRTHWESNHTFTPDLNGPGEPFSIVIPPPNVTGALHMGHALDLTLQDILCRYHRQRGRKVLWVPGTDHAGIATQNVVERALAKEGKTRHDLGREKFIERVWQWREEYGNRILNQIRRMGASVDWTRERFTMDEGLSKAVRKVFVELYKQGYIYKGKYIINWCNRCHTALADDEVDHAPEKGHLWHVRYDLADGSGSVVIATTRPETILGDSGVCVHPDDERYKDMVGKKVVIPIANREAPLFADKYVDREFGTGCLKVTPCHDPNDWMLGHRYHLDFIQCIDENGNMNENGGPYKGMSKEACREAIVADLERQGRLVKVENLEHAVGHCYRCKTVVEPHVSEQWFVATTKLAPAARDAVPSMTQIFPDSWNKTYYNWLDNMRDWCISRQIWWGHRIPAWTCDDCGEVIVEMEDPTRCPKCGGTRLTRESDVLDTWFSSALWPFSTMGWPDDTEELRQFYPTSVLVTGFDILFFWVARMMMMGLHFMKDVPFRHVHLHALVRDAQGRKMSKSLGNAIDPIVMIDKFGCDALRFTLANFAAMGRDIRLSEERIEGYRHFVNKIWNASRFAMMNLPEGAPARIDLKGVTRFHNKWILHRLEEIKTDVAAAIEGYRFNDAAQTLYKFLWNEFCDWYLELIKPDMREDADDAVRKESQYVLWLALREFLILMHPVMPFVTAEIWSALPEPEELREPDLAKVPYPPFRPECLDQQDCDRMLFIQGIIGAVRTIRAELNISPSYRLTVLLRPATADQERQIRANTTVITTLARLADLTVDADGEAPKASASQVVEGCEVIVLLSGAVNFEAEIARLDKELGKIAKELGGMQAKLANPNYLARAPKDLVERDKARVAELTDATAKLTALQKRFKDAM